MLGLDFSSCLLLVFCASCSLALLQRGRLRAGARKRSSATQEGSLWAHLAAGLFEADEAPASARIELALGAIARKLALRGAIVIRNDRSHCAVVAALTGDTLMRGLEPGSILSRNSLYCGSVGPGTPCLVIDYASLSEWRRHPGFQERGWETCLAVSCGGDLVVSFFDSRPRAAPFSRADRALVDQLAPWISSLMETERGGAPRELPVLDTLNES